MSGYKHDHHIVCARLFLNKERSSAVSYMNEFGLVWFMCSSIQSHMQHWTCQLLITIYILQHDL